MTPLPTNGGSFVVPLRPPFLAFNYKINQNYLRRPLTSQVHNAAICLGQSGVQIQSRTPFSFALGTSDGLTPAIPANCVGFAEVSQEKRQFL